MALGLSGQNIAVGQQHRQASPSAGARAARQRQQFGSSVATGRHTRAQAPRTCMVEA
ncbi:hypothetical protein BPSOL_1727 [Bifidobacterium pseudolongum]|nr:hypothetical protein BPSOL_1727 [Bifidobacterium pseudolongum]